MFQALRKIPFIAHSLRHMTGDVPILVGYLFLIFATCLGLL